MKTHHTIHRGGRRHFCISTARLLWLSMVIVMALGLATPVQAGGWNGPVEDGLGIPVDPAGIITHHHVSEMAMASLRAEGYHGDLYRILADHQGEVNYGSLFPDWGYAYNVDIPYIKLKLTDLNPANWFSTNTGQLWGDTWDDQTFVANFDKFLLSRISVPFSEDDKKEIAFLFGVISHVEADKYYHGDNNFLGAAQSLGGDADAEKNTDFAVRDLLEGGRLKEQRL